MAFVDTKIAEAEGEGGPCPEAVAVITPAEPLPTTSQHILDQQGSPARPLVADGPTGEIVAAVHDGRLS